MDKVYAHIEVAIIRKETPQAFLCVITKCDDVDLDQWEEWIPKSLVTDAKDYTEGDVDCTMCIPEWFAKKLEMIE